VNDLQQSGSTFPFWEVWLIFGGEMMMTCRCWIKSSPQSAEAVAVALSKSW